MPHGTPVFFRAVLRRGLLSVSAERVAKDHCSGHDGLADILSTRLPLVPADRAPARTRTSMCSNMRALLARSAARCGVMQWRWESSASLTAVRGSIHFSAETESGSLAADASETCARTLHCARAVPSPGAARHPLPEGEGFKAR